jgi:hypothetical protein
MPRPKTVQTRWHSNSTALLWLAALAALLAGGLGSPVTGSLLTPLADVTRANEGPVETTGHTHVDCCTRTATLLQEIAVMHRSLSQFADSLAVSEARADTLARKLLEAERTARRLWRDNTALRSGLEAALSLEEMPEPTVASSQTRSSSSTSQLSPDAGRMAYPATLPVFGAQLSDRTPGGHIFEWGSSAGRVQLRRCVELRRVPSRPTVPRSARVHAPSLAFVFLCGP